MSDLFAGLDVSTQSCKLVVIDIGTEQVVHIDAVNYDDDLPEYGTRNGVLQGQAEGVSESDPKMWLAAVEGVFERLAESHFPAHDIRAISVSGQQHGLVALEAEGELTRPTSKLWNDHSTAEECTILTAAVGGPEAMIAEVGNSQRPGYTASKILHMKLHEPEIYARSTTLFLVHNYINWYLTGGVRVMEPGDTSGMALWHPVTGKWSESVIGAIGADLWPKLPEIRPADESIGTVSPAVAERFRLSSDCKIDAGSGDNMFGAVGTGNVSPGLVTVSLGTSGTACTYLEEPFVDPAGEIATFCDSTGHYLPLVCVTNLANGYNEFRRLHDLSHTDFERLATEGSPSSGGRLLIPWFGGERTPNLPHGAPIYFGYALDGFSKQDLCRDLIDGHILNLHSGFIRLPVDVRQIRLTGGLARSQAWRQTIADVFEAEVVPVDGEGAALGAALHAAWVWLKESDRELPIEELVDPFIVLKQNESCLPQPDLAPLYREKRRFFRSLSRRLRGLEAEDPFVIAAQSRTNLD